MCPVLCSDIGTFTLAANLRNVDFRSSHCRYRYREKEKDREGGRGCVVNYESVLIAYAHALASLALRIIL